jgi:hypothetical protein
MVMKPKLFSSNVCVVPVRNWFSVAMLAVSSLALQGQTPPPAVTNTWQGDFLNPSWQANPDNWVGGVTPTFNISTVLGFGYSEGGYYYSENETNRVQLGDIVFQKGAGAYTLTGATLHFNNGTASRNTIYNLSDEVQTIENNLYITRSHNFDIRSGALVWSGSAEALKGNSSTYNMTKLGNGELIVQGNLIPRNQDASAEEGDVYSKLAWILNAGTLTFDLSSPSFATEKSGFTLTRGTLKVVGAAEGTSTLDLGNFAALANYYSHNIVIDDSKGGDGTTLRFTELITGHSSSPGQQTAFWTGAVMNIDYRLANEASGVRFEGLRVQQNKGEGNPYYTPLKNGIINFITVTDSTGTGFATVDDSGNEYGNNAKIVRYTDWTTLPTTGFNANTNYRLTESLQITGSAGIYTLTLGGAGGTLTSTSGTADLNTAYLLMEEGAGDWTIDLFAVARGKSGARIMQHSTDGVLTISSTLGKTGVAEPKNAVYSFTGPGTVRLTGNGDLSLMYPVYVDQVKTGDISIGGYSVLSDQGFVVSGSRLEIDGTGSATVHRIQVYEGTLAGKGQIGGGPRLIYSDPDGAGSSGQVIHVNGMNPIRHTAVDIYAGSTLDGSNVGAKSLTIYGNVTMHSWETTYHMTLAADRGDPLTVLSTYAILPGDTDPTLMAQAVVTLAGGDLSLNLQYAPSYNEWIVLLATDGIITGTFGTINGEAFSGEFENEILLTYNAKEYMFYLVYDYDLGNGMTAIALHAIPEPSTVALLAGLMLGGMVWIRRRSR